MDLFRDLIPSILQNNNDVLENEGEYDPWIVNKAISSHLDCILYANEMNKFAFLSNRIQYDYLRYSIRKYRRPYKKWYKLVKDDRINIIQKYFNYSRKKAESVADLICEEDLNMIMKKLDIGGK